MILNRTTTNTVLLFFITAILGLLSLTWTLSRENREILNMKQHQACSEHCFPFASKTEDEECLCADLDGRWNLTSDN